MLCRQASLLLLMLSCLSLAAQGATGLDAVRAKPDKAKMVKHPVKQVRQKDGSVVIRLEIPPGRVDGATLAAGNPGSSQLLTSAQAKSLQNQSLMDQWLDAVTEPRFMTALAAVAMEPGSDARTISGNVDPTSVRNWAEFIDPNLYMRWQAAQMEARFSLAILNRDGRSSLIPGWTPFPIEFPVPANFRAGDPLPPLIWSKALECQGGVEAARDWLTIPSQDPRANSWLRAGQNYRY